jgi:hypothetical protein
MENDDGSSEMMSLKELAIKGIEECNDPEFLDFIYRMIMMSLKE